MKETIRTASILEIYNEAIKDFTLEKKKLENRLRILQAGGVGRGIGGCLFFGIMILLFLLGIISMAVAGGSKSNDSGGVIVFSIFLLLISVTSMIAYGKNAAKKSIEKKKEINQINGRLNELIKEINDRELRKKSLLEAEEVIVAKDLRVVQKTVTQETFSDLTINLNLEKVCPMCAETVKKAAKICRYCGHKFE